MHRIFLLAGLLLVPQVHAGSLQLESPVTQATVVELYTSHGCSSCPPADRWLRRFADDPQLWKQVIPLSFHVDYWDRLGWPDRFASPRFSERQRDYRLVGRLSGVYTPGIVIRGSEWRGWFRGRSPDLSPGPEVGRLSLSLEANDRAELSFAPVEGWRERPLTAHIAVLGFDLSTPVHGGENAGKTLEEDFVVLGYARSMPGEDRRWRLDMPAPDGPASSRRAVAAWISAGTDPAPVQAVAGWLD